MGAVADCRADSPITIVLHLLSFGRGRASLSQPDKRRGQPADEAKSEAGYEARVALRSTLHAEGLRFRKDLPIRIEDRVVRPDVVFTRARLTVFVDGCFWHCCPLHGTSPQRNQSYWGPKLARNVARDNAVNRSLKADGWTVVRGWEHENPEEITSRVLDALGRR